jgi:hypothetical protein
MHRKSLEAAEHIRKNDENFSINDENSNEDYENNLLSSPTTEVSSDSGSNKRTCNSINNNNASNSQGLNVNKSKKKEELKSESVANLRAKAKEHLKTISIDIKIMEGASEPFGLLSNKDTNAEELNKNENP